MTMNWDKLNILWLEVNLSFELFLTLHRSTSNIENTFLISLTHKKVN